jgi:alpha-beta hydrolase superfamily lysophospholipase
MRKEAVLVVMATILLLSACSRQEVRPIGTTDPDLPADKGTQNSIVTADGMKLAYTFHQGGLGRPSVIFLHMAGRDRHDFDALAESMNKLGYSTLQIDLRGHGNNTQAQLGQDDWQKMTLDVNAAKAFIKRQGLNSTRLVLVGASIGANIAIDYAAKDRSVIGLALLSPGSNYHGFAPDAAITTLTIPIFIAASDNDEQSWNASQRYALETTAQFQAYSDAGHGTQMLTNTNVGSVMQNWMQELW